MSNKVKIGFIVGKGGDIYKYKSSTKKAPIWLKKGIKDFLPFINQDNTVPSDVAIGTYIQYTYPQASVSFIDGTKPETINKEMLELFDVVFVIYDPTEVFQCGGKKLTCPQDSFDFAKILNKSDTFIYPHPDFHLYIIDKPKYYTDLKRANIPVAPFFGISPDNALKSIPKFVKRIENKKWEGIILKPSFAGYSLGIKVFSNISAVKNTTIRDYFKKMKNLGYPNITVQKFVNSFGKNFEIRTYWINEKYSYSVATLTKKVGAKGGLSIDEFDTFESEGGNISNEILTKIKPVAKSAMKSILQYPQTHPFMRIDFGCCLDTKECLESFFINEIETMAANVLDEHTTFPAVEKIGDASFQFAKKVKGTGNVKGVKVKNPKKLKKLPCDPSNIRNELD